MTPITGQVLTGRRHGEVGHGDAIELDRLPAHRRRRLGGERLVADDLAAPDDGAHGARLEIVDQHQIGAVARRDQAAITQPEAVGGRPRRGPVGGPDRRAGGNRAAYQVVDMALLGDVERVAVVGAEGDERRGAVVQQRRQRAHVLARAAVADQHLNALLEFLGGLRP